MASTGSSSTVTVAAICAHEVSSNFDVYHRVAFYASILYLFIAPRHRILDPFAYAYFLLYGAFSVVYGIALYLAPDRLGPSLDVYPTLGSSGICMIGAMTLAYCRPGRIPGAKGWVLFGYAIKAAWLGVTVGSWARDGFVKHTVKAMMVEMQCTAAAGDLGSSGRLFFPGGGLACRDPCAPANASGVGQAVLKPILWGSLCEADGAPTSFCPKSTTISGLSWTGLVCVVVFLAAAATDQLNFWNNARVTRNLVYYLFGGHGASAARRGIAKGLAALWFAWSYVSLATAVFLLVTGVAAQELGLTDYPAAATSSWKGALLWIAGTVVVAVALVSHGESKGQAEVIDTASPEKVELLKQLGEIVGKLKAEEDKANAKPKRGFALDDIHIAVDFTQPRAVAGFWDAVDELGEWWNDPVDSDYLAARSMLDCGAEEKRMLVGGDEDAQDEVVIEVKS